MISSDRRLSSRPMRDRGERSLAYAGFLGLILALLCGVWVAAQGSVVLPEGDVSKAFSFNAALGVFLLSTAAVLPYSGMSDKKRKTFRRAFLALALYAYAVETMQHMRGVNPRFTSSEAAMDVGLGFGFALVAVLMVGCYLYMTSYFFRRNAGAGQHPEMVAGVRYAAIAIAVSFAAGFGMSALQGSSFGENGNFLWIHGLGFHALQLLPLAAWLAKRTDLSARVRMRFVHGTGLLFLSSLFFLSWQTALGRTIFEWSFLPAASGLALLGAALLVLRLARSVRWAGMRT